MTSTTAPVVIIGGGLSGLISAALVGRAGRPVVVLEKSSAVGGRASTRQKDGFSLNLGPHALYRHGDLHRTLKSLGVIVTGGIPTGNGGFALRGGRLHTLPIGLASLLSTGVLGVGGKIEFARLHPRLLSLDTGALHTTTLASWLDEEVRDRGVRELIEMLVRVTTFTNDPEHQSAAAALDQLQLSLRGSVLYLHGGWQTMVDGLRQAAIDAGARIVSGSNVVALERRGAREVDGVRLADGTTLRASAVIIAAGPAEVAALTGAQAPRSVSAGGNLEPVRVASLDVALHALPRPKRTVAFGTDVPLYFSVHSAVARLAPDGAALVHVSKYLRPGETAGRDEEQQLEDLMDLVQPGWQKQLAFKQFLPNLTVTHASITAAAGGLAGRPSTRLDAFDNVCIAGDWVGPRGQLSDGCAASAADAARSVMAQRLSPAAAVAV